MRGGESMQTSLVEMGDEVGDEGSEEEGDEAGGYVVEHDAGAVGEGFEFADGPGFEDVEEAEEEECECGVGPVGAHEDEGGELAGYFVDDHEAGIFAGRVAGGGGGGGGADGGE